MKVHTKAKVKFDLKERHNDFFLVHFYSGDKIVGSLAPKIKDGCLCIEEVPDWAHESHKVTVTYKNQFVGEKKFGRYSPLYALDKLTLQLK